MLGASVEENGEMIGDTGEDSARCLLELFEAGVQVCIGCRGEGTIDELLERRRV
jgi:hypothetical protein